MKLRQTVTSCQESMTLSSSQNVLAVCSVSETDNNFYSRAMELLSLLSRSGRRLEVHLCIRQKWEWAPIAMGKPSIHIQYLSVLSYNESLSHCIESQKFFLNEDSFTKIPALPLRWGGALHCFVESINSLK